MAEPASLRTLAGGLTWGAVGLESIVACPAPGPVPSPVETRLRAAYRARYPRLQVEHALLGSRPGGRL